MLTRTLQAVIFGLAWLQAAAIGLCLTDQISSDTPITGVSSTLGGRLFLFYSRIDGSKGPSVVELVENTVLPYPSAAWNSVPQGEDIVTHFVNINAQRVGPDGCLYLVDTGAPGFGQPVDPDDVRLIQVDLDLNEVSRVYHLGNVTYSSSLLDDVRFNGPVAYSTDAGVASIIVLDRATGAAWRALNNTETNRGYMLVSGEVKLLRGPTRDLAYVRADQLEVSPDRQYLYYQAVSGGMHRIETRYPHDNSLSDAQLESYAEPFALTPSTGGTAIDADGNLYNSDTDWQRIIKTSPNGTMSVLLDDPRLLWVDAMWIDTQNRLWLPAAQLNRGTLFNNGTSYIQKPVHVYSVDIGIGPPAADHA